jgi:hypothetical protein
MTARIAWMRDLAPAMPNGSPPSGPHNCGGDQNSAGRYPLISRPMQISTRVGVVQAIWSSSLAFPSENKVDRGGPLRKPPQPHGRKHRRRLLSKGSKTRGLCTPSVFIRPASVIIAEETNRTHSRLSSRYYA